MLFLALCAYIAYIRDGNALFPSLHAYTLSTALFLLGLVAAGALALRGGDPAPGVAQRPDWTGMAAGRGVLLVLAAFSFHAKAQLNVLMVVAVVLGVLMAARAAGRLTTRRHVLAELAVILAAGLFFRASRIADTPLESQSDMLLLVEKALSAFLAGDPAYGAHVIDQVPGKRSDLPLACPPLLWLTYLPAYVAGLDLRWVNVVVEAASALLLAALGLGFPARRSSPAGARSETGLPVLPERVARDPSGAGLDVPLLILAIYGNGYFMHRVDAEIYPFGTLALLLVCALRCGGRVVPYLLLGLLCGISPLALAVVPFAWVYLYRRQGAASALRGLVLGGLVTLLLLLPFAVQEWDGLRAGIVANWQTPECRSFAWAKENIRNVSLGMFAYQHGWQANLKYIQAVFGLLVFGGYCLRHAEPRLRDMVVISGTTMGLLVALNVVTWTYFYQPALLLLLAGLLLRDEGPAPRRLLPPAFLRTTVLLLLAAGAAWAAWPRAGVRGVSSALTVGAYYYVWFPDNFRHGYLRNRLLPPQPPALGEYDSADPAVAEQHIRWCRQAGIGFLALDWWPGRPEQNQRIFDGFLRASNIGDIRFCINYETWNLGFDRDLGATIIDEAKRERWLDDFARLEPLLRHPSYLRMDDRPVVILYLTRTLAGDYRGAVAALRERMRQRGFELYLVGDEIFWTVTPDVPAGERPHPLTARPQRDRIRLFDAITGYNMYEGGIPAHRGHGADSTFLRDVAFKYREYRQAAGGRVAIVPGIIPGYNDRGVRPRREHFAIPRQWAKDAAEGSFLRAMWERIAVPFASPDPGLVLITSWNEWNEDTAIEPLAPAESTRRDKSEQGDFFTQGYEYRGHGEAYLEILRALRNPTSAPSL